MDSRVAQRYARALFNAALQRNEVDGVESDLVALVGALEGNPALADALMSPKVSKDSKVSHLEKALANASSPLTFQVVKLLFNKRREEMLSMVKDEFVRLRRENDRVIFVQITSASELDADHRSRIEDKIRQITGKSIEPTYSIDVTLVGGVKASYENLVLDGTVRGHLNRLREQLRYRVLKQN